MDDLSKIVSTVRKTFEKGAWHGPSVMEVLQDVSQEMAMTRLPQSHSIIELVSHMTSWRNFTIKKLQGDHEYKVSEEMNFPNHTEWNKVKRELENTQQELIQSISSFPPEKLKELVPHATHKYTFYTLIHGIIHHDLYHLGQIVLIKKSFVP